MKRGRHHVSSNSGRVGRRKAIALLAAVLAATVAPGNAYYADEPVNRIPHSCTAAQFPCQDNTCINIDWVCDGNADCANGEDEFCDGGSSSSSSSSSSTPGPGSRSILQSSSCEIPKTDSFGTVESPNFEHIYEPDFNCDYVFIADPDTKIQLNFTFFDLECSTCACCDYLELHQPDASNLMTVDQFCCSDSPETFTSDDNVLILKFVTRTSDPNQLPTSALVSSSVEDYTEDVLHALGKAAAAGNKHGYKATYQHV